MHFDFPVQQRWAINSDPGRSKAKRGASLWYCSPFKKLGSLPSRLEPSRFQAGFCLLQNVFALQKCMHMAGSGHQERDSASTTLASLSTSWAISVRSCGPQLGQNPREGRGSKEFRTVRQFIKCFWPALNLSLLGPNC